MPISHSKDAQTARRNWGKIVANARPPQASRGVVDLIDLIRNGTLAKKLWNPLPLLGMVHGQKNFWRTITPTLENDNPDFGER
jgi:hypothetical protein